MQKGLGTREQVKNISKLDSMMMMIVRVLTFTQHFFSYIRTDSICCFFQKSDDRMYRGENNGKERLCNKYVGELNPGPLHRSPIYWTTHHP